MRGRESQTDAAEGNHTGIRLMGNQLVNRNYAKSVLLIRNSLFLLRRGKRPTNEALKESGKEEECACAKRDDDDDERAISSYRAKALNARMSGVGGSDPSRYQINGSLERVLD